MKNRIMKTLIFSLITIFFAAGVAVEAQTRAYKVRDSQVQYILNRIETRTDNFRRQLDAALDRSALNNTDKEDLVMKYVTDFENATDALKQKFDAKESVDADVTDVLTRAAYINQFLNNNRLNVSTKTYWNYVKSDLNTLARYYGITEDWTIIPVTGGTISTPYRVSDTQVKTLLENIETRTDNFKRVMDRALDRSAYDGTEREDMINDYITQFENETDELNRKFNAKTSVANDVQQVLNRAYFIDEFIKNNRLNLRISRSWNMLKADLNTLASYYNVSYAWTKPTTVPSTGTKVSYNVPMRTVQGTLASIEARTDVFKREMNTALDRSILNNTKSEDAIFEYITEFENKTDQLKQRFDAGKSTAQDVEEVLNRAYYIDGFMRDYRLDRRAEREWTMLRSELLNLRDYYNVSFDFNNRKYVPMTAFDKMLTGTYKLNAALSDNVSEVVDRAIRYYPVNEQRRYERNLERRLMSPEMLAIEKRDDMVKVASSNAGQISFEADGVARTETNNRGQAIKVTANTYYDGVAVAYESDRRNDFYVNFQPISNNRLKVIRRVYLENKNETVTVASVYDKVNETAQFDQIYENTNPNYNERFVVPNNTIITANLLTPISTEVSQNNDRFKMEVTAPNQFDGAIIEGRVVKAERSGRVTGKANLTLDFETITLRNGETYKFAGLVNNIKALNGDDVAITNEGTVKDDSQTKKTITRAGIGAALGALIGAIAGGGEGAAIGAAIGAGAGAGTVVLEGRDDINLEQGSQFTLTATAPRNINEGR